MSTHSLPVAEEIADRLAIIRKGQIIAVGTLDDLYAQAKGSASDLEEIFLQLVEEEEGGFR
jgi:ABC-2 type transport system ATP-binding protein